MATAFIKVAQSNGAYFTNALDNDMLLFPSTSSQRVLIGNSNIGTLLVDSNNVKITGDINFTGGLYQNGVPFTSGGGGGGGGTGTGTGFSSGVGCNLFILGSNIGFNKMDPSSTVDIQGDLTIRNNLNIGGGVAIQGLDIIRNTGGLVNVTSTTQLSGPFSYDGFGLNILTSNNGPSNYVRFIASNTEVARITGDAKLGVGTSNPLYAVDVQGDINFTGMLRSNGAPYVSSQWSNTGSYVYMLGSNVGIGKSNPAYPLDITGDINFTGMLRSNGAPYVSSQWSNTGSNVYIIGSNVGIGKSNPTSTLDVNGTLTVSSNLLLNGSIALQGISLTRSTGSIANITATSVAGFSNDNLGQVYTIASNTSDNYFKFVANSTEVARFTGNSRLGIGVAAPQYAIDAAGDINFTGTLRKNGTAYVGSQWSNNSTNVFLLGSNVGIGTMTPDSSLQVNVAAGVHNAAGDTLFKISCCNTSTNAALTLNTNNASKSTQIVKDNNGHLTIKNVDPGIMLFATNNIERMRITETGNVGISTVSPGSKLDVNGTVTLSAADTCIMGTTYSTSISAESILGLICDNNSNNYNSTNSAIVFGQGNSNTLTRFVEYMRIMNGRVGVGTASPANTFDVVGSGGADNSNHAIKWTNGTYTQGYLGNAPAFNSGAVYLYQNGTTTPAVLVNAGGSTYFNGGSVGIGTASPAQKLHVEDGSVFIGDTTGGIAAANGHRLMFDNTHNLTAGAGVPANKIMMHSNVNVFGFGIENGAIAYQSGENHKFYTGTTATLYGTERFTILNSGNVGIGINTPDSVLQVKGSAGVHNAAGDTLFKISCCNGANYSVMTLNTNNASKTTQFVKDNNGNLTIRNIDAASMLFATNNIERMRITDTGNVGIGTVSPSSALQVHGTVTLSAPDTCIMGTLYSTYISSEARLFLICDNNNNNSTDVNASIIFGRGNSNNSSTFVQHMCIDHTGAVGIGVATPANKLDVSGNIRAYGSGTNGSASLSTGGVNNLLGFVGFYNASGARRGYIGYEGQTANYIAMHTENGQLGYDVSGNLIVRGSLSAGSLSKGSGTFDIPHPVLPNKRLVHSFIEGPRADLIYRGKTHVVNGVAIVDLNKECTGNGLGMTDGTFEALCRDPQVFLQNNQSWDRVRGYVNGCMLMIESENADASFEVDWMVVAERKDPTIIDWDKTDPNGYLVLEHDSHETQHVVAPE